MKSKLLALFLFVATISSSFAQIGEFKIDTINRYSLTQHGTIGDDIPITVHLRLEEFYDGNIFSLSFSNVNISFSYEDNKE